jgi:hypothetical protein
MKRSYDTGIAEQVIFFKGKEIEHTPVYGMDTLFVTGIQPVDVIESHLEDIKHIFFGANHSFNPTGYEEHKAWEEMITYFLEKCFWCTLDIPMNQVEEFNEGGLNDFNMFIPQIRVPIPYIKLWNYNTMLKIDDKDFNATNPGVWTHKLHDLKDRSKFTSWDMYNNDTIIK